jgi:hypothetical protein
MAEACLFSMELAIPPVDLERSKLMPGVSERITSELEGRCSTNAARGWQENRMSAPAEKIIFVTVSGGVAYVCEDSVPVATRVEIIDFDNLSESADEYARLSPEAQAYVRDHFT